VQEVDFSHVAAVVTRAAPQGTRRASRAAQANFYLFGALGKNNLEVVIDSVTPAREQYTNTRDER